MPMWGNLRWIWWRDWWRSCRYKNQLVYSWWMPTFCQIGLLCAQHNALAYAVDMCHLRTLTIHEFNIYGALDSFDFPVTFPLRVQLSSGWEWQLNHFSTWKVLDDALSSYAAFCCSTATAILASTILHSSACLACRCSKYVVVSYTNSLETSGTCGCPPYRKRNSKINFEGEINEQFTWHIE